MEELAMNQTFTVSALRNCEDVRPVEKTLTLDGLVEAIQPRGNTKDGPAICGAVFDPPYRKKANVKEVGALILDIDDAEGSLSELTKPLVDYEAVLWFTWSHTDPKYPKYPNEVATTVGIPVTRYLVSKTLKP